MNQARAVRYFAARSGRFDPGHRRADGKREIHAGRADCAAVGSAPGTLLIDGRPIREWPLETLRRAVGYVPQDTFLFSETLRENVAFGVDERDRRADS